MRRLVAFLARWGYALAALLGTLYALWRGQGLLLWAIVEVAALLLPMAFAFERAHDAAAPVDLSCTVAIPAHDEERVIGRTLASVRAQSVAKLAVVVIDDASTDGTAEVVRAVAASDARVSLRQISRLGKAGALNAALASATTEVFVTVDADTRLEAGALAAMLDAFADPGVEAVSGFIAVADPRPARGFSLLEVFQGIEYARASMLRVGFSRLRMHEQAPGAFTAFRTASLRAVGGFPDSLTEDYEVIFRLYDRARREGRRIQVVGSARAFAVTSVPTTLAGFFAQRRRWFAGFLVTLFRYRDMVFDRRLGAFGLLRLPVKVLDAMAPAVLLSSLAILLLRLAGAALHVSDARVDGPSVTAAAQGVALSTALALLGTARARVLRREMPWYFWCFIPFEILYGFVRAAAVLAAYPLALRAQSSRWKPRR